MLDVSTIYKTIKEAGYLPVNITDGLSDPALNEKERESYLLQRQKWAASRPKVVLIVSRNKVTAESVFVTPQDKEVVHAPSHVYLFSKRGGFYVVPNATALPIIAFVKGYTAKCLVCRASTVENGNTCNGCGYSQCDTCFKKSSSVNGIKCRRCQQIIGDVDLGSSMMAAVAKGKKTEQGPAGCESLKVNIKTTRPQDGLPSTVAEVKLPRQPGSRPQATRLYIDPNINMQPGNDTMLYVIQHRGFTMAQPIINTYCQRLAALKEAEGQSCFNVILCLIGSDIDMIPVTSLNDVLEVMSEIGRVKGLRLVLQQAESAWKAAEKLLQRNTTTGTFAFVASCFFPSEKAIRTELFIVHEIVKDLLVLTNGWICAKCQKPAARKRCSRCGVLRYCSEECYTTHWPTHKGMCDSFVENRILCEAMTKVHEDM